MYTEATYYGKEGGSHWYLPTWVKDLFGVGKDVYKNDYDMSTVEGKHRALRFCYPFASVIDRCGKMMMNGKFYVVDKNGNEKPRYSDVRSLLSNPNPMQNGRSFLYQVESSLRCYGFCPIYLLRIGNELPECMTVIPPHLFHLEGTGKVYSQTDREQIVKEAYISLEGRKMMLEPNEYTIIYDSIPVYPGTNGGEITFVSSVDSLTPFARNYMSAIIARGNLIENGGPKGILYGDDNSEWGNAALTPKEADELNDKFKRKFGLVKKMYEIMVTDKKVGWISLGSNVQQLMLHEETDRCLNDICNAVGVQPDLFSQGAKYENKEAAKRATYQDLIIPDSMNIAEALTIAICPEGCSIMIDFSDVACLQTDRSKYASTLGNVASALNSLLQANLLTVEEARIELSNYIEIDPMKPIGAASAAEIPPNGEEDTEE